jgi:hypothetical protein
LAPSSTTRLSKGWSEQGGQLTSDFVNTDIGQAQDPFRQLVVTLSGESEIELEGGRKIRLGPGHILLAEDTTGQGHISRAVGSKDRITLDIGLADGATLPR